MTQINNLIPKCQQANQTFSNIKQILLNLPVIPTMNQTYAHLKNLISSYPDLVRIDVINGIHQPVGDGFHFNIRVYDKRSFPNSVIYNNLHVYVSHAMYANQQGDPLLVWELNIFMQITE